MYICTCNSITKHVYFPRGIVMVTASYPEIIGHSVRVITVRGKTNQRREGVSSQYLNYTVKTPNTEWKFFTRLISIHKVGKDIRILWTVDVNLKYLSCIHCHVRVIARILMVRSLSLLYLLRVLRKVCRFWHSKAVWAYVLLHLSFAIFHRERAIFISFGNNVKLNRNIKDFIR